MRNFRMKNVEYNFTDGKGNHVLVRGFDSDAGETKAYNFAKTELSKANGDIPSECFLFHISDK